MSNIYHQRRSELLKQLPNNSLVLVAGYQQKVRSKNIKYHFRQDNDFLYLTGFDEPDAIALLIKGDVNQFILFSRPKDPAQEVSFGARAGIDGAVAIHGANKAYAIAEFERTLVPLLQDINTFYISDELGRFSSQLISWANHQRHNCSFDTPKRFTSIKPLAEVLHTKRVIKSKDELAKIRSAVAASTAGHKAVMQACKAGVNERELSSLFDFTIAQYGCNDVAYPSIVAGGNNACCLHYEENCCELSDGQMLLIDAGGEFKHYAADITRSYPVNGRFTPEQKSIYLLVLKALDQAIEKVRPGAAWNTLYETCMQVMAEGLKELGLLTGNIDEIMKSESYKRFTVHKTGHWLGMDVHDVGPYHDNEGQWRTLETDMVFTIEPGIYFPEDALDIPAAYRGMGIRIEDDILVTETGFENLSVHVPRTIEEIEAFML
ncbi:MULTISPECIES: aminopeptidase P N-terminal domain-containing protein [unclassified Shewanella]|uniref:aminopeptidase P N-terminal domain-containing protein n=1 Tax=unclassified Shewanella TaxID=196818 RepID=UPI001BC430C7|nr:MULTISPECIES: aminopeptidase P N-terminal domain-containing protein [unclassified Shewanella]GIU21735.1 Xaa-Pro aminopeptidase [Shewanella sp. MBTL60-112-B1]GIU40969.1 Xaa-Pro aminopeptidase [Shewanella sp. MBTL60-112-B2]